MTIEREDNGGVLRWRVTKNSDDIDVLKDWRRAVDDERSTIKERLGTIRTDIQSVESELRGFRRMMFIGILTAAGSSLTFAFTVLAGTGRI